MTNLESFIKRAKELCEKATPAPWRVDEERYVEYLGGNEIEAREKYRWAFRNWYPLCSTFNSARGAGGMFPKDASFTAESRTMLPKAIEALEAQQILIEKALLSFKGMSEATKEFGAPPSDDIIEFVEECVVTFQAEKAKVERILGDGK